MKLHTILLSMGVLATLHSATPALTRGDGRPPSPAGADGSIGIRLLQASANRRDDPRARRYIVDHINPGTTISRRFEVVNTSTTAQRITVYPGAAQIRQGTFVPATDPAAGELSTWVSVDHPRPLVPPGGHIPITAIITIPKSAAKGERYGAIWAQVTSAAAPGTPKGVRVVNRVGIRIYLDVGPGGDPVSDFRIDQLTPGRTPDGMPVVKAAVHNTGERALDLTGRMRLAGGPGGLNAGPFPVRVGTTLAPGDNAPVSVVLDDRLPDGPWKVELTLESGRVRHTVTATLMFPAKPASWGTPAATGSSHRWTFAVGVLVAMVLAILAVLALRLSHRRQSGFPA